MRLSKVHFYLTVELSNGDEAFLDDITLLDGVFNSEEEAKNYVETNRHVIKRCPLHDGITIQRVNVYIYVTRYDGRDNSTDKIAVIEF
ncbi:MAG: hypothetical protein M0Q88_01155 [Bacilli bacterium]|nr:hypothetical protein [Bacilli bacterium]